jgi:formiminoglutamate deiminase
MPSGLWFETALLPGGWARRVRLTLEDGRIATVDADVAPAAGDERHAIGVPGLPNVHSHAFQRALAGLTGERGAAGDSFWSWRDAMYRFVDRLSPDDVRAIAALAFAEMLESGFTRVGEFHYLHHAPDGAPYADVAELAQQVVAAAELTGIGLTLLPVFYAHAGFGGAPPCPEQRRFVCSTERYAELVSAAARHAARLPDAVVGVAPHSLRAVDAPELATVTRLRPGAPVHIHVAEQVREVEECLAFHGRRPVEWLLEHAAVDGRWCLVHATHVEATELAGIARCGAVVGLCPVTEADLGDGLFPAGEFLAAGGRIGVGSDSNVSIDAAVELRTLEYGQRLAHRARNVLARGPGAWTGRSVYDAALAGGTVALGGTPGTGGISSGASADLVALAADDESLVGRTGDALLDSWIFGSRGRSVDRVWRRGREVVRGGRHVARAEIAAGYRAAIARLAP